MEPDKANVPCGSKIRGLLLIAGMLLISMMVSPAVSASAEKPMGIDAIIVDSGAGELVVEVSACNVAAAPAAGDLEFSYDPDCFMAQEVSPGSLFSEATISESNLNKPGVIRIAWADPLAPDGEGREGLLFSITFLGETEQPLILNLTGAELFKADGSTLPFQVTGDVLKNEKPCCYAREIRLQIGKAEAWVNGNLKTLSEAPFIKEGRTMVPLRFISEHFGAEVSWLPETNQVKIKDGDHAILLTIEAPTALVDGAEEELDSPAIIIKGTTFVPLRFTSTVLGATLEWDGTAQSVVLRYP